MTSMVNPTPTQSSREAFWRSCVREREFYGRRDRGRSQLIGLDGQQSERFQRRDQVFFAPCLYLRPQFRPGENQRGKGEGPLEGERGRVPGRRSRCCGFAEVLGFFRAESKVMNIGFRDFTMTAWSFRTNLTKWDPVTRSCS